MTRKITTLAAIIMSLFVSRAADASTAAYWPIEEGSGTTIHDISGNNNHGTIGGASWAVGCDGYGLFFAPASDDSVVVPHASNLEMLEGSYEIIFNLSGEHQPGGDWRYIMRKESTGPALGDLEIYLNAVNGRLEVEAEDATGGYIVASNATSWADSTWYHVAYVFDSDGMRLYVDGVLQDKDPYPASMESNTRDIEIGARTVPTHTTQSLGGWIDKIRISDVALTAEQFMTCASEPPMITSIQDVGNDQGRQVRITWARSLFDAPEQAHIITGYGIYRRQDQYLRDVPSAHQAIPGGRLAGSVRGSSGLLLDGWDYVLTVPARGDPSYQVVAPSLCDSTAHEWCWSTYFVSALTTDPLIFFDSLPDSGYSVDNLAPPAPGDFRLEGDSLLAWNESEAPDLAYFTVYGSYFEILDERAVVIAQTRETSTVVPDPGWLYYFVTGTDYAGNEGDASWVLDQTGVTNGHGAPGRFILHPSEPNPMTHGSRIRFELPVESHVSLLVYSAVGRVVARLIDGSLAAGRHSVSWDRRVLGGARAPAGVYFYRLETGAYRDTRKLVVR